MNETDLMSPSKVAEQYGGNKQKIAQAVQMGLIDPTVGVMAGMFIDRMRGAAMQEQQPKSTVAQDVMAAPQAGLPAAAAAPVDRGLAALPVDEGMVPGGEGYAGGGIIAFDNGGDVDIFDQYVKAAQGRRDIPLSDYELAAQERYKGAPERAQAAKDQAFWEFITKTGFGAAASKSPRALQAFGEAGSAATPTLTAGAKEARDIEEAGAKGLAEMGKTQRAEKLAAIGAGERMAGEELSRQSREDIAKMQRDSMERIAREKETDFQRKWSLYTQDAKKRGVEPTIQEFQKIFPESRSGDFLSSVIKNNPYGDPASWFTQAEQLAKLSALSGEDREAARWALDPANKDKPQSKAIRQRLGI